MISELNITQQLRELLAAEVEAHFDRGCLRVLTPFEYPDGDGVVVRVEQVSDGRYVVSDGGDADMTLVGILGTKAVSEPASKIARRYNATFDSGQLVTTVDRESDVADACQRIALAAVGVAEGLTWGKRRTPKILEFIDVVSSELCRREIEVEAKRMLEGASGHPYTASLFIPTTETVIEPVGAERSWNAAAAVYVEFSDLGKTNGYRLMAILDDRENEPATEVASLLSQVAEVASWREHDAWLPEIASR